MPSPSGEGLVNSGGGVGFKLKKVDKRAAPQKEPETADSQIIDFKARLRKVEPNEQRNQRVEDSGGSTVDSSLASDSAADNADQQDDKRRSTGSISSLKKLWENKEANEKEQLSPKLGSKKEGESTTGDESPEDYSAASTRSSASKTEDKPKPEVPAKPKSTKTFGGSIYATPNCNKSQAEESSEPAKSAKQGVLEISTAIENSIVNLKGSASIAMASWLQLSDKVGLLHGMCVNLTDNAIAPQSRFQFRDLLARLELQARQLRVAGTRNIAENTRLLSDVQNTIKDVTNMVQR